MSALTPARSWRWQDGSAGVVTTEQSPEQGAGSTGRPSQGGQVSGVGQVCLVTVQTHCQLASYI